LLLSLLLLLSSFVTGGIVVIIIGKIHHLDTGDRRNRCDPVGRLAVTEGLIVGRPDQMASFPLTASPRQTQAKNFLAGHFIAITGTRMSCFWVRG
jgi:hypothetical protein